MKCSLSLLVSLAAIRSVVAFQKIRGAGVVSRKAIIRSLAMEPPQAPSAAKGSTSQQLNMPPKGYSDDAFGLIFLTGLLYCRDYEFTATFLANSALAASTVFVSANSKKKAVDVDEDEGDDRDGDDKDASSFLESGRYLPAVATLVTVAVSVLRSRSLAAEELVVCAIGIAWCLFKSSRR
jgi:hypothetical protein